jgi:VWFA-related protein
LLLSLFCGAFAVAQPQRQKERKPPQQQTKPKPEEHQDDDIPTSAEGVKLGTELVNVLFSAADGSNRIVGDLKQDDITVFEDGRPQELFTFRREANLPISIGLLIDLSGSQEFTFPQEKTAAAYFLRSVLRPLKDSAAILTFRDDVELIQGLTPKMDTLARALDEIQQSSRFGRPSSRSQATALYDAVYITVDEVLGREEERARSVRFAEPSEYVVKRRAIILLTDGVDNASNRKLDETISRAWKSGVMIYAIGIGDRFRFEGVREDVLRKLSEETGGRAFFPQGPDELNTHFAQIESELRSQYLVAYSPSNTERDGSFRRIEVRVKGRQDVRLIHRRGYYAPAEGAKK